jgi:hypothetical protein
MWTNLCLFILCCYRHGFAFTISFFRKHRYNYLKVRSIVFQLLILLHPMQHECQKKCSRINICNCNENSIIFMQPYAKRVLRVLKTVREIQFGGPLFLTAAVKVNVILYF